MNHQLTDLQLLALLILAVTGIFIGIKIILSTHE